MSYTYNVQSQTAPNDELCHYGVIGMKWGKRKASYYDAKSKTHASAIANSKTRLGKSYHNYRAYRNEIKALDKKAGEQLGKGSILKDIDSAYGHGASARSQTAAANYYNRKSGYTKSRLSTTKAKAAAYNNKTAAEANTRLHNSKSLKQYGTNYVNAFANRSIKTWSGRTTTTGKKMVDELLTGGMIGLVSDVSYYRDSKPKRDSKK
jgi:hypothetical protein